MQKISLVIGKGADNYLWGRASFEGNLIVDSASSMKSLEVKIKNILHDLHAVNPASIELEMI